MWNKEKIRQANEADLILLKDNQVSENRSIEYKLSLTLNSREEKREFLTDVCSFAFFPFLYLILLLICYSFNRIVV